MLIQAEISLYPLDTPDLAQSIYHFVQELEKENLEVEIGAMSTVIAGEDNVVFDALRRAYLEIGDETRAILVVKIYNGPTHPEG